MQILFARQSDKPGRVSTHCQFARLVQLALDTSSASGKTGPGIDDGGTLDDVLDALTAEDAMTISPKMRLESKILL